MEHTSQIGFVRDYKPGTDAVVELKNGRFVDVMKGCFYEQGLSLVIKNGEIASMPGLEGEPTEMTPDFSIDLKGKTVLPGLFNVHCHIQLVNPTLFSNTKTIKARKKYHDQQVEKNMADCLARGITHIRDAFTEDLRPNRELKDRILKREIPGPRIQQAVVVGALGGYLTPEVRGLKKMLLGLLGLGKIEYEAEFSGVVAFPLHANEAQIQDAVNRAIDERGADLIKVGESLEKGLLNPNPITISESQLGAITNQAQRRNVQSTIHCVSVDTFRRATRAGFSSLAHMPRDESLTQEDVDTFFKAGCLIEPTLSVGYDMSWKLAGDPYFNNPNMEKLYGFRNRIFSDLAAEFWLPELKDHVIAGFNKANLGQYKMLGLLNLSKLLAHYSRLAHFGFENTKKLVEQGATIACGNDGGIQSCTPAMVSHELSIFDLFMNEEAGGNLFDGVKAVQTATINSARSMGIDEKFGSIETGKIADLAIIEGDPFQNLNVIGKPVDALFMEGRLVVNNCDLTVEEMS